MRWLTSFFDRNRRARRGMTAVELVTTVGVVGITTVMLVPAIQDARSHAQVASAQTNMQLLWVALQSYVNDNNGYQPVNSAVNGGDWTPKKLGYSPAGKDIWGIPPIHGGGSSPQSFEGVPPTTYPLGHGALVTEGYADLTQMYDASERVDGNLWWDRRIYFGDAYQQPWSSPTDPGPWAPWYGGGNYWFQASYTYRSGDWSTLAFDPDTKMPLKLAAPLDGGTINAHISHNRPTTAGFTSKSILVENSGNFHAPAEGANVLVGDGSVVFWNSPEHAAGVYTRNYVSTYPQNPLAYSPTHPNSGNFHGGFRSMLMDAADKFRDD